jgi:hypothetical protein
MSNSTPNPLNLTPKDLAIILPKLPAELRTRLNLTKTSIWQLDYTKLRTEIKNWAIANPEAAVAFVALLVPGFMTSGIARLLWDVMLAIKGTAIMSGEISWLPIRRCCV